MRLADLKLFAACVGIWGTTWLAITFQLGSVAPSVSVALRFGLASLLLAGYCAYRGFSLKLSVRCHGMLLAMGVSMFTIGYMCVYVAESYVVSGLVAVGYCATPLANQVASRVAFGTASNPRVTWAGLMGLVGIGCVYWPELARLQASREVLLGTLLTAGGVLASTVGNVFASRAARQGVNVWQKMTFSMAYGALACGLLACVTGANFAVPLTVGYLGSLLYLTVFGTIAAFACYLTLLETIGAARAGYVGVLVPIVALSLSALFEGYRPEALALVGVAVVLFGNSLIMRPDAVVRPSIAPG
jgi:drug/metabolite transporter (DMT)-like permease